jgi:signal transduction histidine kinase/FixJ family two-component response regulator
MPDTAVSKSPDWGPHVEARGKELLRQRQAAVHLWTDRLLARVMVVQFFAAIAAAVWISPRTWAGASSQIHIHVWTAILLGGAISSLPILLARWFPGSTGTRHVIAAAQMLMSALLIHLSGGRIETHFHVFGSLAILAFYRDWKVLVTATTVVAIDHLFRGLFWPESVFGVITSGSWRWAEHAAWVAFEVTFLLVACRQNQREMRQDANQRALLENTNEQIIAQKQTEETLVAATRAKSEFLANMSHEIRTPMTAILGYADILMGEANTADVPAERIEAIRTIQRNGQHLLELINDILDLSKIEARKLELERIACSPVQVLGDVISLMRVRAAAKSIALNLEYVGGIPQTIQSDPLRLRQILINLLGNAIKFTESGSVRVVASLAQNQGCSSMLQVDVIDSGIGLTQQQISMLFRPFSQVDSSATRRFGGTGLGLTISKRLAVLLGGDIAISSIPGKGSTFSLTVDAGRVENVALLEAHVEGVILAAPASEKTGAVKLDARILLAEDGLDNQRLIGFILKKSGAEVTLAENGQLAVDHALAARRLGQPFDVILMDMQMPVMDGYTATRRLRELGYTAPIIALTAHAMAEDRQLCLAAGCDDYATKPIDRRKLLAAVADWTARGRTNADRPRADDQNTAVPALG